MDVANRFAALQVIVKAIEEAGTLDKAKLNDVLHNLCVMTVEGPIWFNEYGKGTANPFLVQIQNGEFVIIGPPEMAVGSHLFPRPTWSQLEGA